MKNILALMLLAGIVAGCSSPSEIALSDGRTIITKDAPELDDDTGFYVYEQVNGDKAQVNKDLVETITPVRTLKSIR